MNTAAKAAVLGILKLVRDEHRSQKLFDRAMNRKSLKKKRKERRKESVMKMESQCPRGQQFRRRISPNR